LVSSAAPTTRPGEREPASVAPCPRPFEREQRAGRQHEFQRRIGHRDRAGQHARPQEHAQPTGERSERRLGQRSAREAPQQGGGDEDEREVKGAQGEDLVAMVADGQEHRRRGQVVQRRLPGLVALAHRPGLCESGPSRVRGVERPGLPRQGVIDPRQPSVLRDFLHVGVVVALVDLRPDVEPRDGRPAAEQEAGEQHGDDDAPPPRRGRPARRAHGLLGFLRH
jgi:hypothetical protein